MLILWAAGDIADWLTNNVAPEWIVIASVTFALLLFAALLVVLERALRGDRYHGTRRVGRPAGAEPYARGEIAALRIPPYVDGSINGGRHRAAEWTHSDMGGWPGRLR